MRILHIHISILVLLLNFNFISEQRKKMAKQANCRFCFDNPEVAKHLIISIGTHVSFT